MPAAYVVHETDLPLESWDDPARGQVTWRTLFSADSFPSEALSGGIAYVPAGEQLKLHRHAPPEIYFILEGEPVVVIDGVEHACRAGNAVFIPGNAEHGIRNVGRAPAKLFYCFAVDRFSQVEYRFPEAGG